MPALVSFREVNLSDAAKILAWRRKPRVTNFMNTDLDDDVQAQAAWLSSCYKKPSYYHWVFMIHGSEAGLVSVSDLDLDKGTTSWGYYVGEESLLGLGALVPPYLYNWIFRDLGLKLIEAEVFANNDAVLRMHRFHGYRREPNNDRTIVKSGQMIQLIGLQLHAKDWLQQNRMQRFVAPFPTRLWAAGPKAD